MHALGPTKTERPELWEEFVVFVGCERATGFSGDSGGTLWPKHLEETQQVSPLLLAGSARYWKD